jgi:hypothetical protein
VTDSEKIAALRLLLADTIDLYNTASDEVSKEFLAYLVGVSVTAENLFEVVKVLASE